MSEIPPQPPEDQNPHPEVPGEPTSGETPTPEPPASGPPPQEPSAPFVGVPPPQFAQYPRSQQYFAGPVVDIGVISQAWNLCTQRMGTYLAISILYFAVMAGAMTVLWIFVFGSMFAGGAFSSRQAFDPMAMLGVYAIELPMVFLMHVAACYFNGALSVLGLRHVRGEAMDFKGALTYGGQFSQAVAYSLLGGLCLVAGGYCCYLPYFIAGGLLMFAPLLIADQKHNATSAMALSARVLQPQLLMASLAFFVFQLVSGLGAILCIVGVFITYPLLGISAAILYDRFFPKAAPQPNPWG